jgi:hypothetical protein
MIGIQPGSQMARVVAALPAHGGITPTAMLAVLNAQEGLPPISQAVLSATLARACKHHYAKRKGNNCRAYTYHRDRPAKMSEPKPAPPPKAPKSPKAVAAAPEVKPKRERDPEMDAEIFAFVPRNLPPRPRIEIPERVLCAVCDTFGADRDCPDCGRCRDCGNPWHRSCADQKEAA